MWSEGLAPRLHQGHKKHKRNLAKESFSLVWFQSALLKLKALAKYICLGCRLSEIVFKSLITQYLLLLVNLYSMYVRYTNRKGWIITCVHHQKLFQVIEIPCPQKTTATKQISTVLWWNMAFWRQMHYSTDSPSFGQDSAGFLTAVTRERQGRVGQGLGVMHGTELLASGVSLGCIPYLPCHGWGVEIGSSPLEETGVLAGVGEKGTIEGLGSFLPFISVATHGLGQWISFFVCNSHSFLYTFAINIVGVLLSFSYFIVAFQVNSP